MLAMADEPFAVAVTFAVWFVVKEFAAEAVNVNEDNPEPATAPFGTMRLALSLLSATDVHPTDAPVSVTVQVLAPPAESDPGVQLTVAGTVATLRLIAAVCADPFKDAVSVGLSLVVNCFAVAVKVALADPVGMATEAGTVRFAELDASATVAPVAPFTVTVHVLDAPGPSIAGAHTRLLTVSDGALTVTVPTVPVISTSVPVAEAPEGLLTVTDAPLPPDGVIVTAATTPSEMTLEFIPHAIHVYTPEPAAQLRVFPAAVSAAPAATLKFEIAPAE